MLGKSTCNYPNLRDTNQVLAHNDTQRYNERLHFVAFCAPLCLYLESTFTRCVRYCIAVKWFKTQNARVQKRHGFYFIITRVGVAIYGDVDSFGPIYIYSWCIARLNAQYVIFMVSLPRRCFIIDIYYLKCWCFARFVIVVRYSHYLIYFRSWRSFYGSL